MTVRCQIVLLEKLGVIIIYCSFVIGTIFIYEAI